MGDVSERIWQDQVEHLAKLNGWLVFHPSPHQVRTRESVSSAESVGACDTAACRMVFVAAFANRSDCQALRCQAGLTSRTTEYHHGHVGVCTLLVFTRERG